MVSNCRTSKSGESNKYDTNKLEIWKALQKRGSEQARAMAPFAIHLRNLPVKLITFCGSRLNVLFWNAACVTYHQQHFNSFIELYGTPNNLLQAVQEDMNKIENMLVVELLVLLINELLDLTGENVRQLKIYLI